MDVPAHLHGVMLVIRDGRLEEAIELLHGMIDEENDEAPNDADVLVLLGSCYGRQGMYLEAEHYLSLACTVRPDMPQAHFNLGQCFHARGRLEMAVRSYENALRADPGYEKSWKVLRALKVTLSPDLQAAGAEHGFEPVEEAHAPTHERHES